MINVYLEYFRTQLSRIGIDARSEKGANAVEYILIALLIAVAIFGTFRLLGQQIDTVADDILSKLGG